MKKSRKQIYKAALRIFERAEEKRGLWKWGKWRGGEGLRDRWRGFDEKNEKLNESGV